ncbi:MAG TPA: hypothetical protein VGQ35_09815 [Dongiaceae bacterium]|jgi:hypothetical protein|nr:hypothetical protein [Dongiaceae bacterium]
MLASILIGVAALVAVCLSFALFLFAHLTGRVRRSTALRVAILGVALGACVAGGGFIGNGAFGPMAVLFGVFLMLAAGINGVIAYQASKFAVRR